MTQLPWIFEPCDPEGARDQSGKPWAHAVRGRKPQRPAVLGYGHTESAADFDARAKASQQDAREVLGARGEVVTALFSSDPIGWDIINPEGITVTAKLGGDVLKVWKITVMKVAK